MDVSTRATREILCLRMPHFEENRLMLPSHLPLQMRCVLLDERHWDKGKREKQNMLALVACVRLHQLNLLNDRLLPLKRKDMQNKLLGVALTELVVAPKKALHIASDIKEVHIYPLHQYGQMFHQNDAALGSKGRHLCLMTVVPFPSSLPELTFQHLEIGKITCSFGNRKVVKMNNSQVSLYSSCH